MRRVRAVTADERRVEVAAEALWRAAHYRTRNEAGDAARAVVAALDAHDGDLRERLAGAVEALPPENATGSRDFGRGYASATRDAARIVRNRP